MEGEDVTRKSVWTLQGTRRGEGMVQVHLEPESRGLYCTCLRNCCWESLRETVHGGGGWHETGSRIFWFWCLAVLKQCHDGCLVSVQALLDLGFGCYCGRDFSAKVQSKLGRRLASIPGRGIVGFFSGGGLKQQTAWNPIICLLSLTTPTSLGVGLPTAAWHADDHFQGSNNPRTPPLWTHTHTHTEWLTTAQTNWERGGGFLWWTLGVKQRQLTTHNKIHINNIQISSAGLCVRPQHLV